MNRKLDNPKDWLFVRIAMDCRIADLQNRLRECKHESLKQDYRKSIAEYKRVRAELKILAD